MLTPIKLIIRTILSLICFSILFIGYEPLANAQEPNKEINIKVTTNPKYKEFEKKYQETLDTLSPEEKARLEQFDAEITKAHEPQYALESQTPIYRACAHVDPEFQKKHDTQFESFSLQTKDNLQKELKDFRSVLSSIDFIDKEVLKGHVLFQRDLQSQLMRGFTQVITQEIIDTSGTSKHCTKLGNQLDSEFKTPYATYYDFTGEFKYMHIEAKNMKSCGLNYNFYNENKEKVQTSLLFANSTANPQLEISTTIYDAEGQRLDVEETWVSFGGIDTRFNAQTTQPYEQIQILIVKNSDLRNIMKFLAHQPAIVGAKTKRWDKAVAFKNNPLPSDDVVEMIKCMASIDESIKQYFVGNKDD